MNFTASIRARATTLLSTLRNGWKTAFSPEQDRPLAGVAFPQRDFGKDSSSIEFHRLIDVLDAGRRRISANTFVRVWIGWWCWVFIGLIVAAAFLTKMTDALVLAALLLGGGAAAIYAWVRRTRPSLYYAACRLDATAGLHDRMSTALCFEDAANPGWMVLRQRQDALSRVSRVDVGSLFPIRMPAIARRALLLGVVAGGMLLYRLYYQPPIMAFLQASARSHLLQTALANRDSEADQRAVDSTPQDFWKKTAPVDDPAQSDFQGDPSSANTPDSQEKSQSLAESLVQALKNLTSNGSGQQSTVNGANPQQTSSKNSALADNSAQGDPSEGGTPDDSQLPQSDGQHISPGAGDKLRDPQPVAKNTMKSTDPSVKAVLDRVALASVNLKDQPLTQANTATGAAHMAVRDISPPAMAVVNGGEQDDIPARYRLYVQRYFEHEDDKQK